jgi:hypothetical protein
LRAARTGFATLSFLPKIASEPSSVTANGKRARLAGLRARANPHRPMLNTDKFS